MGLILSVNYRTSVPTATVPWCGRSADRDTINEPTGSGNQ